MMLNLFNPVFKNVSILKKGAVILFLTIIHLVLPVISSGQQYDIDFSEDRTEWEYRYHSISKVVRTNDVITIDIPLERFYDYSFQAALRKMPGYKAADHGKETRRTIPVKSNEKLTIKRPYQKNDTDSINISLAIKSATFIEDGKTESVQYELIASGNSIPREEDLVMFYTEKKYKGEMLFNHIERLKISLLDVSRKPVYPNMRSVHAGEEMEKVKFIIFDLEESADFLKDKVGGVWVSEGRFANKTISQIFMETSEADVFDFINYIVSNPRPYMGRTLKVNEVYADWIKAREPKGNIKATIYGEFDKWWPMQPIGVDFNTGKINGYSFTEAMNKFTTLFPFYDPEVVEEEDDDEDEKKKPAKPEVFDYSLVRNSLTYYPKQKALKVIISSHPYVNEPGIYGLSPKELTALLGKPARVIGNAGNPLAYIFDKPYGSLEVKFNTFYGVSSLAYLYMVKPLKVIQVEKD